MEVTSAFVVDVIEKVPHCVGTEDLVRDVGTQHHIVFILENRGDVTRPQLKPVCVCVWSGIVCVPINSSSWHVCVPAQL